MSETMDRESLPAGRTAAITAVVALVTGATGRVVPLPGLPSLDLAAGLAVPLALLFGVAGALAVAAGVVLGAAATFSLSWLTALDAAAYAALAYVGYRLWGVLPAVATGEDPTLRSREQWVEFAAVTLLAGVTGVAVLAWGTLVLWGGFFHAVVLRELAVVLLSTMVVGPAVIHPATARLDDLADYRDRTPLARGTGAFRGCVVVPVAWILAGSVVSLVLGLAQLVGTQTFVRHGYGDLVVLFDPAVVGAGGRRILVVAGAATLALVAATYAPTDREPSTERSTPTPRDA